jgi:hypothetical protein
MKPLEPKLDETLVWDESGHLADTAVSALADGELELLPDPALQHADTCSECADRVGAVALLALEVAEVLGAVEQRLPVTTSQVVPARTLAAARRRPLPLAPLMIALVVAFIAILPSLNALAPKLIRMQAFSALALPLVAQLIAHVLTRAIQSGLLVWVALLSAGLLLLGGTAIARAARPARNTRGNP